MYPHDFPVPEDQGGPGDGQPIGGFGGNSATDRDAHRAVLARLGRAPVLLVHGNGGAADVSPWDLLDQRRFLLAAGYADELIWAPSYLGPGTVDLVTPNTDNIDDVRSYLEAVCEYLGVEVVDVIAHSLGCTLMYGLFRGLTHQASPISWDQPKKWHRVGTFVSLAGAFHGLGTSSIGEWRTGGEFITELLQETEGGGGETPFAATQTPSPAHVISYFCGTASGDFVDAQNPGTGRLSGATNRSYHLGSGTQGHQAIKENQAVFDDFRPLLNSVPPRPVVRVTLDPDSGEYPSPLAITVRVDPPGDAVSVTSSRVLTGFQAGYLVAQVGESATVTVGSGGAISLVTAGRWEVAVTAAGAATEQLGSYWVGVRSITTSIVTDNTEPFDTNLMVTGSATDPTATLYYSLDYPTANSTWNIGATVTIMQDSTVSFVAINPQGLASDVVSRTFTKRIPWDDAVTADAISHYLAGRIDVIEYLAYSEQFGFFTPFTLYLSNGHWVLDPNTTAAGSAAGPAAAERAAVRTSKVPALVRVAPDSAQPGTYPFDVHSSFAIVIEASLPRDTGGGEQTDTPRPVHFTRDGSIPTETAPSFVGAARFEFSEPGNHVIACRATDGLGNTDYRAFAYTLVGG